MRVNPRRENTSEVRKTNSPGDRSRQQAPVLATAGQMAGERVHPPTRTVEGCTRMPDQSCRSTTSPAEMRTSTVEVAPEDVSRLLSNVPADTSEVTR